MENSEVTSFDQNHNLPLYSKKNEIFYLKKYLGIDLEFVIIVFSIRRKVI